MAAPKTRYVRADAAGGGNGTVDAASGPGGNYAWTWNEFMSNLPRYGDTYYIKGPYTYTLTTDLDFYAGRSSAPIVVEGYYNSPGDNPTGNNRPRIACGVHELDLGGYFYFRNFRITISEWLGCYSEGPNTIVQNCSSYNTGPAIDYPAAFSGGGGVWIDCDGRARDAGWFFEGNVIGCCAYNCDYGFISWAHDVCIIHSITKNCGYGVWMYSGGSAILNNTFYNCSSGGIFGENQAVGPIIGNVFDSGDKGVEYDVPAGREVWLDYNNYENLSGSDTVNCSKGEDWTSDDPEFFDFGTSDFRVGPGIRGQGFPKWQDFFDHILNPNLEGWSDQGALQRREEVGEMSVEKETGPNARGGTGSCVRFTPSSTVHPQVWVFKVPCQDSIAVQLDMWHKITSGFNGSFTFSASGSGITPINEEVVALTDDGVYHEFLSSIMTPTESGYIAVTLRAKQGVVSGSIFVDDITTLEV